MRLLPLGLILALTLFAFGCANGAEDETVSSRNATTAPPLRYTTAQPLELSEWWTNGRALLRLRPEGGYDLYPGVNRYKRPSERGQWSKRSYVALEFEPYAVLNRAVERVQLDRDSEGEVVLLLRNLLPFVPIDAPPRVMEDELFGSWRGGDFLLTLDRSMRYHYRRLGTTSTTGGAAVSGHEGSWSIRGRERGISEIVLTPDAPGLEPILFKVIGGEEVAIEGAERLPTLR